MKEKIFVIIIIALAVFAIIYKIQTTGEITQNIMQNNLSNSNNFEVEIDKNLNLIGNTTLNSNTVNDNNTTEENNVEMEENSKSNEVISLTSENFNEEVLKSDKTVIVDFYADWCGPCQVLSPRLEEIAKENSDIKVCKLNVDYEEDLSIEYGVQYLPTVIVFKEGKIYNKIIGLQEKDAILEKCK